MRRRLRSACRFQFHDGTYTTCSQDDYEAHRAYQSVVDEMHKRLARERGRGSASTLWKSAARTTREKKARDADTARQRLVRAWLDDPDPVRRLLCGGD